MILRNRSLPDDEDALLDQVGAWPQFRSLQDLSEAALREITAARGVDFATALLFDRLVCSEAHGDFIRGIEQLRSDGRRDSALLDTMVAVAPGAFYAEYPQTGAGGDAILKEAARVGCRVELIPTLSVGTPEENGQLICQWLADQCEDRIVLASLSKGGTDVKMALADPRADDLFGNVTAWINVGGILNGSPMVSWILSRRLSLWTYRCLFWWLGYDFGFATNLDRRLGGKLDFELSVPAHLKLIHVVGFPLRKHMSSPRARSWHRRLAAFGPNDGVTLLAELLELPGHVLPVWGTDHYSQDGWDAHGLMNTLLHYVAEELDLYVASESVEMERR